MSQTLQQQSLIFALSKCAIKITIEKLSEKFDCFVLKLVLCQQGRFARSGHKLYALMWLEHTNMISKYPSQLKSNYVYTTTPNKVEKFAN